MSATSLSVDESLSLLRSGRFSDFTIKCKSTVFAVHKLMLLTKSAYFDILIDSPFKEGVEDVYTCRETEPRIVAVIITFIYTQQLHTSKKISGIWPNKFSREVHSLPDHVEVYLLADRLMLFDLRRAIGEVFLERVSKRVYEYLGKDMYAHKTLIHQFVQMVYDKVGERDDFLRPGVTKLLLEMEAKYRPVGIAVIDSETSDSDVSSSSSDESDEDEEEVRRGSGKSRATKQPASVRRTQITFQKTLQELMTLAEEKDPSAVHSGRLLVRACFERVTDLEVQLAFARDPANRKKAQPAKRQRVD
ncbi:uncharacterized protein AB675_2888 [Cyphellophora attinorum]|uniref:BTB domain-containing protein n=1 Tax=Cyphellophora attinorum TaxID=1664694 RepID=A0A0N1H4R0_9EURO|nr:uncharacterized protein AB675_2888 [Phialophora attinorum]KPI36405.1 hypothetical protein AB675_2888 [Phialophora attinorum]